MKALIAYESQTGHTRQAAEAIATAVRSLQGEAVIKKLWDVKAADVAAADVLFVGTWVKGHFFFNVAPARAQELIPNLPPLDGKPVGVFCTYLFNPRGSLKTLGAMLEALGAMVVGERAFRRSRTSEGVEAFVRGVLAGVAVPAR
jgi:flavodoxin